MSLDELQEIRGRVQLGWPHGYGMVEAMFRDMDKLLAEIDRLRAFNSTERTR
jgi:hypothetical protein